MQAGLLHLRVKDEMSDYFYRRWAEANDELTHLQQVFKDSCWYNFEVHCRDWQEPWPKSCSRSTLCLHGYRVETTWVNGRKREYGTFPVYYWGSVQKAPHLPPQILINELILATKLRDELQEAITAPYDYAPGGHKYEELLTTTLLPTQASLFTSSKCKQNVPSRRSGGAWRRRQWKRRQ